MPPDARLNYDRWMAMVEGRWEDYGGESPDRFRARILPCIDAVIDAQPATRAASAIMLPATIMLTPLPLCGGGIHHKRTPAR